jgi:protein gp37
MAEHPRHRFQVLTKHPLRMSAFAGSHQVAPHIWLGTSVENRKCLWRIDVLRTVHAGVRWVSFEPLLKDIGAVDLSGIVWAVIGGESAPLNRVRSMHSDWARALIAQCRAQGFAPYMKQLGTLPLDLPKPRHKKGGDMAEWPADLQVRQFPIV